MSAVTQSKSIAKYSNRDECPVCGDVKDLEPHHWSYEPEITIDICRDCHKFIHDDKRVREQSDDWQEECVRRIAVLDVMHNDLETEDYREKYNIPDSIK